MQFGGGGRPPVGVLFDGSFDSMGDLLALAVLHGLQSKGEARTLAISVNRSDFSAAQFCDVVRRYYGMGFNVPMGVADGPQQPAAVYGKLLAKSGDQGQPSYKPALQRMVDSADPATLLRNALTASEPKNSVVVASGSIATVARLLALRGSKPLIQENVRHLVVAGVKASPDCRKLFDEWPAPVFLCAEDIGEAILYPAAKMEAAFGAAPLNPIGDAYREFGSGDVPAQAPAAALFAVRSSANLFQFSPPEGKVRRLVLDPAQADAVVSAMEQLAAIPARNRGGRRGGGG